MITTKLFLMSALIGAATEHPRVLFVGPQSNYAARGLKALRVAYDHTSIGDLLRGDKNVFDYEVIITGLDVSRSEFGQLEDALNGFTELGGVLLCFRWSSPDVWLPSPMRRDRSYQLGKILQKGHPIFNRPHAFDEAKLNKVHSGSIYAAFYDLDPCWKPLLSTGPQQAWDKQPQENAGPHYGIVEGVFGKGRILLVQMIPAYAWFHDEKGDPDCPGARFFENIVRYALSKAVPHPITRKERRRPEAYSDSYNALLKTPKGADGLSLGSKEWRFTKKGPYAGDHDRRGVFTIGHPDVASTEGNFGQIARRVSIPQGAGQVWLRVYQSDDYCGGYEPKMVGDRRVSQTLNRKEGFRFKQVLIDGKVVYEEDVLGRNPQPAIKRIRWLDISPHAAGKESVEVALRVLDRKGTGEDGFATDVFWAAVDCRADLLRLPAGELAAEGFERTGKGVALVGKRGALRWRVAALKPGDYMLAFRLRDDPYGQSSVTVAVNGDAKLRVSLSADDLRYYWLRLPIVRLGEGDVVSLHAEKDGEESVVVSELAVVPAALAATDSERRRAVDEPNPIAHSQFYRPVAPAKNEEFALRFSDPAGVGGDEIVCQGVPFPFGALRSHEHIAIFDAEGRELPVQTRHITTWPDKSVQAALVCFPVHLPAGGESKYTLRFGAEVQTAAEPTQTVRVVESAGAVTIDTGPLRLTIPRETGDIVSAIELNGRQLLSGDGHWGAEVIDENGQMFSTDGDTVSSLDVAESGPLRAIVVKKGTHRGSQGELLSYRYEMHFAAGSAAMRLFYTFSNVSDPGGVFVKRVTLRLPWESDRHTLYFARPDSPETIERREGRRVDGYQHLHDTATLMATTAGGDQVEHRLQARLSGWASACGQSALNVALRYCWQMFPKRITLDRGVRIDLVPEPMDEQDIPPEAKGPYEISERPIGGVGYPQAMGRPGLFRVAIGESVTHELWIHVSDNQQGASEETFRSAMRPAMAWTDPAYVASTKVFAEFHPTDTLAFPDYESGVQRAYERFMRRRRDRKQYGMENFGDDTFEWGYGPAYTFWSNQEDDRTHGMLIQYLRSGDWRWWELGEQAARHYRDVDCVLAWPGNEAIVGGPRHHNNRHFVSKGWVSDHTHSGCHAGHSWIEGLVDYWLLTGDLLAGEAARRMGEWYVRQVETFRFGAGGQERGQGWTLTALTTIYRATGDRRYLEAAQAVQDWINDWQDPVRGVISVPISEQPSYEGGTTFMHGIVAHGIARLADVTGDPATMRSLEGITAWIVTEPMGAPGKFYYKQAPSLKRGYGYNGKAMTAMSYVYRMTDDPFMGFITHEIFTHTGPNIRSMPFLGPTVAHLARWRKPVWIQLSSRDLTISPEKPGGLNVRLRNTTRETLDIEIAFVSSDASVRAEPDRAELQLGAGEEAEVKTLIKTSVAEEEFELAIEARAADVSKRDIVHIRPKPQQHKE